MATLDEYKADLEGVQAQIKKIRDAGQQFDIAGRTTALAELRTLYAERRYLRRQIARLERTGGSITIRQAVPRG